LRDTQSDGGRKDRRAKTEIVSADYGALNIAEKFSASCFIILNQATIRACGRTSVYPLWIWLFQEKSGLNRSAKREVQQPSAFAQTPAWAYKAMT
jgi:hypothetical protein